MSKPANPLSKFRSHNYYHVLALCDSSETAEALSSSTSLDVWQHPTDVPNDEYGLGAFGAKDISGSGRYCILINGSTDAAFAITRASWKSVTNGSATQNDNNTSIALEGSIDISEPRGVLFLDRVVGCCLELGIDSSSAVWCLKTFFVGYTDEDKVEYITDVQPIMFLALYVTGSFTEQGGSYNINFVSISHGASRLPAYSKSGAATNFKVGSDLKSTLQNLNQVVQSNYQRYYDCVEGTVSSMPNSDTLKESLRYINYVIEVIPPYDNPDYKVEDQLAQAKTSGNPCEGSAVARIDANSTIESGIHAIMSMCEKVKKERAFGDENGIKYDYKILTTLESTNQSDKSKAFTAYYRIQRQEVPSSISVAELMNGGNDDKLKENTIEFDYIYTGKNIDILEFDMKLSAGLAYLQIATSVNSYNSALGDQPNTVHTISKQSLNNQINRMGKVVQNVPVTFGTMIKSPTIRNTRDGNITTQSAYTMSKHASLEVSEVSVKIIGNPRILANINKNSAPSHVKEDKIDTATQSDDALPGWGRTPSFAKIHIKMPRNNDDLSLFTGKQADVTGTNGDYAVDFWFDGYYYIVEIEHIFDNGEFTQVMNMLGIPETDILRDMESTDTNSVISQCYDNTIGCKNSQNKPPLAIPEQRPNPNTVLTRVGNEWVANPENVAANKQADILNSAFDVGQGLGLADNLNGTSQETSDAMRKLMVSQGSLSDIEGYDNAPAVVKSAIDQAAIETNASPADKLLLANIISAESSFNPNPPSVGNGVGLGQIFPAAWKEVGQGPLANRYDPNANALATAKYINKVRSSMTKALGRTPTNEEIYLGYWQGPGAAPAIIKRVEAGTASREDIIKLNNAKNNLNRRLKGKIPHVPHSVLYKNDVTPDNKDVAGTSNKKKNKDVIAAIRNCAVEDEIKKDNSKNDCITKPTNNVDEKSKT